MGKWYVDQGGQPAGPFSTGQIRQKAQAGEVTPQTRLRRDDVPQWFKAASVKGLFAAAAPVTESGPVPAVSLGESGANPFDFFGSGAALPADDHHEPVHPAVDPGAFRFGDGPPAVAAAAAAPPPTVASPAFDFQAPPARPKMAPRPAPRPVVKPAAEVPAEYDYGAALPTRPGYTPPPMPAAPLRRQVTPILAEPVDDDDDDDVPLALAVQDDEAPPTAKVAIPTVEEGALVGAAVVVQADGAVRTIDGTTTLRTAGGWLHARTERAGPPTEVHLRRAAVEAVRVGPVAGGPGVAVTLHAGGQIVGVAVPGDGPALRAFVAGVVGGP